MFTVAWLKDTAERALATAAEVLGATLLVGVPVFEIDWTQGLGVAATAAIGTVLKSAVATRFGDPESASIVK